MAEAMAADTGRITIRTIARRAALARWAGVSKAERSRLGRAWGKRGLASRWGRKRKRRKAVRRSPKN